MEEKEKLNLNPSMSRRKFIKASAVVTATTGAVLSNPVGSAMKTLTVDTAEAASKKSELQVFSGACRGNCAGGCFLNIEVRDGKVIRTAAGEFPDPDYNRICVKGLSHVQRIYNKDRLKYPMKRVGERGEGKWERITWDEAITTITDKWKEYEKEFGKESYAINWGSGNYASVAGVGMGGSMNRLLNVLGCANIQATVDAAMGHSAGNALGWGPNFTLNESKDFKNAKTIIVWGANPVISQQQSTHFLLRAKEQGTKLIVIDPTYNITASKADMYVPIVPGTDGALALAMMNIVVRENWIDEDFLKTKSVAPFLVKEDGSYLRLSDIGQFAEGQEDQIVVRGQDGKIGLPTEIVDPVIEGTFTINEVKVTTAYSLLLKRIAEYPPEKAAEITKIPVETIEELTEIYARNTPSTIYSFFGLDHYVNGHYSIFSMYSLAMITGNLGKPGAGCGMGENLSTNYLNLGGSLFPDGAVGPAITMATTEMDQVMDENRYFSKENYHLKSVYFTHINMLGNAADRKYALDWMKKLDLIVVADMNMNETAQYADILLPVAHWFEVEDMFSTYSTHPYVIYQEKAIEPLYECKSDFHIAKLISEKMGVGQAFNLSEEEYIKLLIDTDAARELGITYENLKEQKIIKSLPGETYIYGGDGTFLTPTGRAQFYVENPAPNYDLRFYDQEYDIEKERLPYWEPPYEASTDSPLYEKYPFFMISDHSKFRTHTQWWDVPVLLELDPEPLLKINPVDAKKYGIKTGDKVKVYNDRGYVVLKAALNGGNQPGILTAPKGWEKAQFIDGHFADLSTRHMNPVCANSNFNDLLVAIEKV